MKNYLVYGAGIFGKILRYIIADNKYNFAGYISDIASGDNIVGKFSDVNKVYTPDKFDIALGIGYSDLTNRLNLFNTIRNHNFRLPSLIHKNAVISESTKIGDAVVIMANSTVDIEVVLNDLVVLWPGVIINHECVIGKNTFISPGAIICGNVIVGDNCFIGAGSIITEKLTIPCNTFVKAGIVVSKNNISMLNKFNGVK